MIKKVGKVFWSDFYYKGKRVRRSLKTNDRFRAIDRLQKLKEKLELEDDRSRMGLNQFCRKYLEWAWNEKPVAAEREQQRLAKIKEYFKSEFNIIYLDEITPYHAEQLKAKLKQQSNPELSKKTINYYLQILRNIFKRALIWGDYKGLDPIAQVRPYKVSKKIRGLTRSQLEKVLEEAREISSKPRSQLQRVFYDLCLLALNTGMRRREIVYMRWNDIKDDEVVIRGKGDKERAVPLNETAKKVISRQPHRDEYIFDIPKRYRSNLLEKSTDRIKRNTGVGFNFHLLRHAFATSLIEKGVDIITVAEILGHSSMSMTAIYSHTTKSRKKDAVLLLEN